jgi:hypothetical protein
MIFVVGGIIFDNLPGKVFQDISRDTKIFVVRLLGFRSSLISSLFLALILSGNAIKM